MRNPPPPKFPVGARVVVVDYHTIERYADRPVFPMTGWVERNEPVLTTAKGRFLYWNVYVRGDMPHYNIPGSWHDFPIKPLPWREDQLVRVHLKLHGKLLRNSPAISCPWCREHGRDPRLKPYYIHPEMPDCQCWHHHHEEHMRECPFR